jgi:hypothetical protein
MTHQNSIVAELHANDPAITHMFRISSPDDKIIKILAINPMTSPSGILPIFFREEPAFILVEITPDEFQQINQGILKLPENWSIAENLYAKN